MSAQPLVSVCCLTYNHVKYIADAIEGFLIQKTSFPFEIIIHDDASTDGTEKIVKEYADKHPELIVAILQSENQYSKNQGKIAARFVWPRTRGKYIAWCEGDDYWTDRDKLQKQVDFLESNHEFGLIYSMARVFDQRRGRFIAATGGDKEKFEDIVRHNPVVSLTACFRKDLMGQYMNEVNPVTKKWKMGDYPLWLYIAHKTKIKFDKSVTGVYRITETSVSNHGSISGTISFIASTYEISCYYLNKYGSNNTNLSDSIVEQYVWRLFSYWCRFNIPGLKKQIECEMGKIMGNKSTRIRLIQISFSFPPARHLFNIYYRIRNYGEF